MSITKFGTVTTVLLVIFIVQTALPNCGLEHLQLVFPFPIQQLSNWSKKFRREQSKFEIDIAQILQAHESKPKKARYRKLDERIQHLTTSYNPSQLDQYLKNIFVNINL